MSNRKSHEIHFIDYSRYWISAIYFSKTVLTFLIYMLSIFPLMLSFDDTIYLKIRNTLYTKIWPIMTSFQNSFFIEMIKIQLIIIHTFTHIFIWYQGIVIFIVDLMLNICNGPSHGLYTMEKYIIYWIFQFCIRISCILYK